MRHAAALIVKFILTTIVLEVVLLLFSGITFGKILWISLSLTIIAYVIGDMVILPATNNIVAAIADMGLALVIVYLFNFIWNTNEIPFYCAFIAGVLIGIEETFYHKIVDQKIDEDEYM